jgi:hypothetical protein
MKSSLTDKQQEQLRERGRVIARGIEDVKVEQQKNMAKAEKRHQTMLERAAERALSGGVQF